MAINSPPSSRQSLTTPPPRLPFSSTADCLRFTTLFLRYAAAAVCSVSPTPSTWASVVAIACLLPPSLPRTTTILVTPPPTLLAPLLTLLLVPLIGRAAAATMAAVAGRPRVAPAVELAAQRRRRRLARGVPAPSAIAIVSGGTRVGLARFGSGLMQGVYEASAKLGQGIPVGSVGNPFPGKKLEGR